MKFQDFVRSEFGTRLWAALGRWLPRRAGYALADLITAVLSRRRGTSLYRVLYANQAGVRGVTTPPEVLHTAVRDLLRHAGMVAVDLMHLAGQSDDAIRAAVEFGADFWPMIREAKASGRGVMACGCHLSNFNLGFLAFALGDIPLQVLSVAQPTGGFEVMHRLRSRGILDETPIDAESLRKAVRNLRQGGFVATGADWPLAAAEDERLPFFGRPARLPTGHIRLAMSGNALLLPIATRWSPTRGYYVQAAPPMELELTGDRAADIRHNALRVLAVLERWIAETPEQWLMYYPVWPEE